MGRGRQRRSPSSSHLLSTAASPDSSYLCPSQETKNHDASFRTTAAALVPTSPPTPAGGGVVDWSADGRLAHDCLRVMGDFSGHAAWFDVCVDGVPVSIDNEPDPSYTEECSDGQPAWSPDGTRIAFVRRCHDFASNHYGPYQVWVMNGDGSDPHPITFPPGDDQDAVRPAWSPDGTEIAFLRSHFEGGRYPPSSLYRVRASGGRPTLITSSTVPLSSLDWGPNPPCPVFGREVPSPGWVERRQPV